MSNKSTIGRLPRDDVIQALREAAAIVLLELSHPYEELDENSWVIFVDMPTHWGAYKYTLGSLFGITSSFTHLAWVCLRIPTDKFLQTEIFPAWFEKTYVEYGPEVGGIRVTRLDIMCERRRIQRLRENTERTIKLHEARIQELLEKL